MRVHLTRTELDVHVVVVHFMGTPAVDIPVHVRFALHQVCRYTLF